MSNQQTQHDLNFERSISLATAFVANGDIRLSGNTREDSTAIVMVKDLIASLYKVLEETELEIIEANMLAQNEVCANKGA
jgi:hypothetical protein